MTNPGAIVWRGEIIGVWTGKKSGNRGLEFKMTLWAERGRAIRQELEQLAVEYAAFRGKELAGIVVEEPR